MSGRAADHPASALPAADSLNGQTPPPATWASFRAVSICASNLGDSGRRDTAQQRILDTLAALEVLGMTTVAKHNLAVLSGQSPKSSAYGNNLGALRSAGRISYPADKMAALTEAGRALAQAAPQIRTLADLHAAWFAWLPNPQVRILTTLIACHPQTRDRVALAEAVGQSPTSSAYGNNLGALRTLGLIDYPTPGQVVATALLFPPMAI